MSEHQARNDKFNTDNAVQAVHGTISFVLWQVGGCRFVLYNVGSIIMTKAINTLYLIFVHFYALAFLASCSTR